MTEINTSTVYTNNAAYTTASGGVSNSNQTSNFDIKDILKRLQKGDTSALDELRNAGLSYLKTTQSDGSTVITFEYGGVEYEVTYIPQTEVSNNENVTNTTENKSTASSVITINEDNFDDIDLLIAYVTAPNVDNFDIPEPGPIPTCGTCGTQNQHDEAYNRKKFINSMYYNLRQAYMRLSDEDKQHALNSFKNTWEKFKDMKDGQYAYMGRGRQEYESYKHSNFEGDRQLIFDTFDTVIMKIRNLSDTGFNSNQTLEEQWEIYVEDYYGVPASVYKKYIDVAGNTYDFDNIIISTYENGEPFVYGNVKPEYDSFTHLYRTEEGELTNRCPYYGAERLLVLYKKLDDNQIEATVVDKTGKEEKIVYEYSTFNELKAKGLTETEIGVYFQYVSGYDNFTSMKDIKEKSPMILHSGITIDGKSVTTIEELIEALKSGLPTIENDKELSNGNLTEDEAKETVEAANSLTNDENLDKVKDNVQEVLETIAEDLHVDLPQNLTFPLPDTDITVCDDCGDTSVKPGSSTWSVNNINHYLGEILAPYLQGISNNTVRIAVMNYIYDYAINPLMEKLKNGDATEMSISEYIDKLLSAVKQFAEKLKNNPNILNFLDNKLSNPAKLNLNIGGISNIFLKLDDYTTDESGKIHLKDKEDDRNYQLLINRLLIMVKAKYAGVVDDKTLEKLLDIAQTQALDLLNNNIQVEENIDDTRFYVKEYSKDLNWSIPWFKNPSSTDIRPPANIIITLITYKLDELIEEEIFDK